MNELAYLLDSADEAEFHNELRDWLSSHLPGGWNRKTMTMPREPAERRAWLRDWQATMAEDRWVGIHWPAEYGGRSATLPQQIVYSAELALHGVPQLIGHRGLSIVGPTLIRHGTVQQRDRFLERIRFAEDLWASGFSEPSGGSDLAALRTRGEVRGNKMVVNGQKIWTSNAHWCDWMYTLVRTDPNVPKHRGISALVIPLDSPGVTIRPIRQITGGSEFNEVFFDDVEVPLENVVGALNAGWQVNRTTLSHEHSTLFIAAHGRLTSTLDKVIEAAKELELPSGLRSDDPALRNRIARSWCKIQVLMVNGLRNVANIHEGADPGPAGSISKLFGQETQKELFELAIDVCGSAGLLDRGADGAVGRGRWLYGYLSSRAATIGGGTSEIHRSKIAENVLGMPKDSGREELD